MDRDDMISTTSRLGGFSSEPEAERAIETVLETLGERLSEAAAVRLATFLPEAAATALLQRRVPSAFSRAELFDRVGRRMGVDRGRGLEHVLVVCEALATLLPPEETERLHHGLPAEIADLFTRRSRESIPHRHVHATHEPEHTLAGGRQGSWHPLSEATPKR